MRLLLCVVSLFASLTASTAWAQIQEGDVVVSTAAVELKVPNAKVGSAAFGEWLTVTKTNDKWLWVKPKVGKPGWIGVANVVPLDKADGYFTAQIEKNPRDAAAYAARGVLRQADFAWDKALADFDAAIANGLKTADAYCQRGITYAMSEDVDKALVDFNQALQLDPNHGETYSYRGLIWEEQGKYDQAIADYQQGVKVRPNDPECRLALAELLATCPVAKYRNGQQAVVHALKAREMAEQKIPQQLAVIAAAYAEAGDFKQAVKFGEQVLTDSFGDYLTQQQARLELYKAGKPYHRPVEKK